MRTALDLQKHLKMFTFQNRCKFLGMLLLAIMTITAMSLAKLITLVIPKFGNFQITTTVMCFKFLAQTKLFKLSSSILSCCADIVDMMTFQNHLQVFYALLHRFINEVPSCLANVF